MDDRPATKQDLPELGAEFDRKIAGLKAELEPRDEVVAPQLPFAVRHQMEVLDAERSAAL